MLRWPVRRRRDLVLDAVFVVWVGYIAIAGHVLPDEVVSLFRHGPPAAVVTDPLELPHYAPDAPAELELESHSRGA